MKKYFTIFFFISGFISIYSYEKHIILEALDKLKKTMIYKNSKGEIEKVNYNLTGYYCLKEDENDCYLIINGKVVDPYLVLNDQNNQNELSSVGEESSILKGITEAHNFYRRALKLPELVWNSQLAAFAQEWANYLKSQGCRMKHRPSNPYGENLAWAMGKNLTPEEVVQMWYSEVKDYDYASNTCRNVCGHYTQVVWRNSKRLGCGIARCGNTEVWVCNYDPPGNYIGERPY